MASRLFFYCALVTLFSLMTIVITTTTTTTNYNQGVQLRLGGEGDPKVIVTKNGEVCKMIKVPDVPQPYGEPGRIGSYVTAWDRSAMVCGGYSGSGPPFSAFRDCEILDLATKTWSLGPQLVNFTASRESRIHGDHFYIFGGDYPSNPRPGPTIWKHHDIIQALNLDNLQEGWRVIKALQHKSLLHTAYTISTTVAPSLDSTLVTVPSKLFPSC